MHLPPASRSNKSVHASMTHQQLPTYPTLMVPGATKHTPSPCVTAASSAMSSSSTHNPSPKKRKRYNKQKKDNTSKNDRSHLLPFDVASLKRIDRSTRTAPGARSLAQRKAVDLIEPNTLTTVVHFDCIEDASIGLNIDKKKIGDCCRQFAKGNQTLIKNYYLKYADMNAKKTGYHFGEHPVDYTDYDPKEHVKSRIAEYHANAGANQDAEGTSASVATDSTATASTATASSTSLAVPTASKQQQKQQQHQHTDVKLGEDTILANAMEEKELKKTSTIPFVKAVAGAGTTSRNENDNLDKMNQEKIKMVTNILKKTKTASFVNKLKLLKKLELADGGGGTGSTRQVKNDAPDLDGDIETREKNIKAYSILSGKDGTSGRDDAEGSVGKKEAFSDMISEKCLVDPVINPASSTPATSSSAPPSAVCPLPQPVAPRIELVGPRISKVILTAPLCDRTPPGLPPPKANSPTAPTNSKVSQSSAQPSELTFPIPTTTIQNFVPRRPSVYERQLQCVICQERPAVVVLEPCQHCVLCRECSDSGLCAKYCPSCRTPVFGKSDAGVAIIVRPRVYSIYTFL
uniref:RING-type domain-containing protein n=1 Tax=Corethron hystrix TaxID=216773 RepID=A0A7S1BUP2_9STRA|mmetsp:Transcript_41832/g.97991  ORF Transcript_41832/g.97991 Transcript_41832/m.97991 type:complete len:575 (+) Transcript_41832:1761-3485(+)